MTESTVGQVSLFVSATNNSTPEEEQLLIRFFGNAYVDYRRKTFVWIPFIH